MSSTPLPNCPTFDPAELNLSDAEPIGSGAISQVVQSRLKVPPYGNIAVKILSKLQLLQQNKVKSAMDEKQALIELGPHPFIVRLFGTAQSEDELYFVMEHLPHGDLLEHIRRCVSRHTLNAFPSEATLDLKKPPVVMESSIQCLDFHDIQLITAQLVLGLSHVVRKGFVLRDLKTENIAFDCKHRVCLIDFDTVDLNGAGLLPTTNNNMTSGGSVTERKKKEPKRRLTVSAIQAIRKKTAHFCGTAQYVSPEMIGHCEWSYSSDLWALGVIVYEMMYGTHMFSGSDTYTVLKRVMGGVHSNKNLFPHVYLGPESDAFERVKDFILQLCCTDPTRRLGVHPVTRKFDEEALRRHPFFGDFSWSLLDEHVQSYRAPDFMIRSPETGLTQIRLTSGPLHPQMLDDGTVSLKEHYHTVPIHNEEYAKYVFEATADANPFERWAQTMLGGLLKKEDEGVNEGEGGLVENTFNTVADNGDSDEEDMDVIDDVGMQFFGRVHPDFADMV